MQEKIRWAVCGLGGIAKAFMRAAKSLAREMEVVACASSSKQRAEAFQKEYGLKAAYTYQELAAADGVDAVYVCTNMHLHYPNTVAFLQAGKAVLCEKSFALNVAEAEEMARVAKETNVLLMEAMWTRFLPSTKKILQLAKSEKLGKIVSLEGSFCCNMGNKPECRIFDKKVGGGSVLDLMVYPVSYAWFLLGNPKSLTAEGTVQNGVDTACAITLGYDGGVEAKLYSASLAKHYRNTFCIQFEKGRLQIPFFHAAFSYKRYKNRCPIPRIRLFKKPGYTYQLAHFNALLRENKKESPLMPLANTLAVMQILTEANNQMGVDFKDVSFLR